MVVTEKFSCQIRQMVGIKILSLLDSRFSATIGMCIFNIVFFDNFFLKSVVSYWQELILYPIISAFTHNLSIILYPCKFLLNEIYSTFSTKFKGIMAREITFKHITFTTK